MLVALLDSLSNKVEDITFISILSRIWETLINNCYINVANYKWTQVKNGLMSGWKTTSIFGTIINYLVFWCVRVIANLPEPTYIATQGDDLDISFDRAIWIADLYSAYEQMKFTVAK